MARKKKLVEEVDESQLVTVPEIAPGGAPFVDVAYEHRGHREPHECCGVTFKPGHVITLRTLADVPTAMREDPLLSVHLVDMGACRLQTTFRYTPMSGPEFNVLVAQAEALEVLRLDATNPRNAATIENVAVEPEPVTVAGGEELYPPEPLPDEAEPEGGE